MDAQIGLEDSPDAYVAALVAVFGEVKRVLRNDGTLWLNLSDGYANDAKWGGSTGGKHANGLHGATGLLADEDGAPLALPVNPAAYPGAHFATFSPKLVEPMVLASTSAKGCCPKCGAPHTRVVERTPMVIARSGRGAQMGEYGRTAASGTMLEPARSETTGWRAGCACADAGDPVPAVVLDPFAGACTTGLVARKHGRHSVLIDLSAAYLDLARERLGQLALPGLVAGG